MESDLTHKVKFNKQNFPDDNFRRFLAQEFGWEDGELLPSKWLDNITTLDCSRCGIEELTGVNLFSELRVLKCYENDLTELEINNPQLYELDCSINAIWSLDLNCPNLQFLYCSDNPLDFINTSKLPSLVSLECKNCGVIELDLSNNPLISCIYCEDNCLESLDVSKNNELEELFCDTNIDVTGIRNYHPFIAINGQLFDIHQKGESK